MNGEIIAISRLRMASDGEGVSTLVAFFDCLLSCKYCLNDYCHNAIDTPRAEYTPEELIKVLRKDEIYYLMTNGGIVFGGGEPLLQSQFIHEVCQLMNSKWKRRIETSLNVPWENIELLLSDIDEWIIDIKDLNDDIYKKYTGVSNENMISNLLKIKECIPKESLHIRIPNIPGYNTKEDVDISVQWIKMELEVEPEVFDYYELHHDGLPKVYTLKR